MAANAPSSIDAMETMTIRLCHDASSGPNVVAMTRSISAIAATFGAVAKNTVTGVGAPS